MKRPTFAAIFFLWLCFAGCSSPANEFRLDQKIKEFHLLYEQQDFERIYIESSSGLKSKISKKEFIDWMSKIRFIMGDIKQTTKIGSAPGKKSDGRGDVMIVRHKTTFKNGEALEDFSFDEEGKDIKLFGYNFNSDYFVRQLMVK